MVYKRDTACKKSERKKGREEKKKIEREKGREKLKQLKVSVPCSNVASTEAVRNTESESEKQRRKEIDRKKREKKEETRKKDRHNYER